MHRSLQNQLLAWLAALSVLGAALRPTFDTVLFAIAFVVGTIMVFVQERLEPLERDERVEREETRTVDTGAHVFGRLVGASVAWGLVAARHFHALSTRLSAHFPTRLTTEELIAAAVVPSGIFLLEGARLLLLRRAKSGAARDES